MKSPHCFDPTIFRRYDIRGTLPTQFTVESAYALIRAILTYYQQHHPNLRTLTLGRDGRSTSPALADVVRRVCQERGIAVHDLGLCSSPEFYYAVTGGDSGIMITASHNNAEYNGFKLRLHGKPVWGEQLQGIKQLALAEPHLPPPSPYVINLVASFQHLVNFPYHLIIDCSNGATGPAIAQLVSALRLPHVTLLNATPDGTFPGHPPDPTKKENVRELIAQVRTASEPTIGLALDGDGDRLIAILEDGTHCVGDELLALLATPVLQKHPGAHVVYESKSSRRLTQHIAQLGGIGHLTPCGHTYIHDAMEKHNALLGGEVSGHLFFADRYHGFDDGLYALLRLLELRLEHGSLMAQYAQLPTAYASEELRIPCTEERRREVMTTVKSHWRTIPGARLSEEDGIRVELADGWFLIRASQTEPLLSARCEGINEQALQRLKGILQDIL